MEEDIDDEIYCKVVNIDSVRMILFIENINNPDPPEEYVGND